MGYAIHKGEMARECSAVAKVIDCIVNNRSVLNDEMRGLLLLEGDRHSQLESHQSEVSSADLPFIIADPLRFHYLFAHMAAHSQMIDLVAQCLGTSDIIFHFANVTIQVPNGSIPINCHRDFPNKYVCPNSSSFLRIMVCLDGMTEVNGATEFVPGSHLISDEAAAKGAASSHGGRPRSNMVLCDKGDLVLIHPKVLHRTPPNRSLLPRRNVIVQWGRADDPVPAHMAKETLFGASPHDLRIYGAPDRRNHLET